MPRFTVRTNCEFSLSIEADNADAAAALAREVPDSGWDAAWGPRPNRNLGRARALPLGGDAAHG